uniref:Uncharacterized protein n=1 Tax=Anguilla anguilla TaxID=7936 RepID=A0A0E9RWG6_ANGAN
MIQNVFGIIRNHPWDDFRTKGEKVFFLLPPASFVTLLRVSQLSTNGSSRPTVDAG